MRLGAAAPIKLECSCCCASVLRSPRANSSPPTLPSTLPVMQGLEAAQRAYALALCTAITACRDLHSLLRLLAHAAADVLGAEQPRKPDDDAPEAEGELEQELAARRRSLAAAAAQAAATSEEQRALFYASPAFQDVAETLLTGGCCQGRMSSSSLLCSTAPPERPSRHRSLPARSRGARLAAPLHPRAAALPV